MIVGVPTEIKPDEYRVAITPAGVRELGACGHEVVVQSGAGEGSAISDEQFLAQGARIVPDELAVFEQAELVLKVKEPQPAEVQLLHPSHTLFTYLHLAAEPELGLEVVLQEWHGGEVVERAVEEPLDLPAVEIDRDHAVGPCLRQEIGHELRGDRLACEVAQLPDDHEPGVPQCPHVPPRSSVAKSRPV